jgi:zinc D-Ala-D-Ala carboxypeptidase
MKTTTNKDSESVSGLNNSLIFSSKYFTLEELTSSSTASRYNINNQPDEKAIYNLNCLCNLVLDPLRVSINKPIKINSGYRSPQLNKMVGGSLASQHCYGKAADMIISGVPAQKLFDYIIKNPEITFDQVILEFNRWVHISYDPDKLKQRQIKLIASFQNNRIKYQKID